MACEIKGVCREENCFCAILAHKERIIKAQDDVIYELMAAYVTVCVHSNIPKSALKGMNARIEEARKKLKELEK